MTSPIPSSIPAFPNHCELRIEHQQVFHRLLEEFPQEASDMAFAGLYVWRKTHPVRLSVLNGILCVSCDNHGMTDLLPPLGAQDPAEAAECVTNYLRNAGKAVRAVSLPPEIARTLAENGLKVREDRDNFDYVYLASDLAELAGRNFAAKRNKVSKCLTAHECKYVRITRDNVEDALRLTDEWCRVRGCSGGDGLDEEHDALTDALRGLDALELTAGGIVVDGTLQALSVAERLNAETAIVHFEKANPDISGLYQLVNQWSVKNDMSGFRFVNREQDLGLPGLRAAKESYHPHHLVSKSLAEA
jgi:hypothetical protein